ncbi:MAG: adenylate cyclase [Eubacteriales bacterium]|nr:adenylate cyclase [Eubacteriales bacterium]
MKNEIERKWLIDIKNIPLNLNDYNYKDIEQAYLLSKPTCRIRKEDSTYFFTIKENTFINGEKDNYVRKESNFIIDKDTYDRLILSKFGIVIKKRRYNIPYGEYIIELDIFKDEYKGLIYAEIEFDTREHAIEFTSPDWFGLEVTLHKKYSNLSLAKGSLL